MSPAGEALVDRCRLPSSETEEQRLLSAARAGDETAFAGLMQRHVRPVTAIVRRFAAHPNDWDDLVQETFVRAYQHLPGFRGRAEVRTWLIRIAINLCRERRRSFWSRRVEVGDDATAQRLASVAITPSGESELRQEVAIAVAALPERLRLPLVMHVFDELTGAEIAAALGCSQSTIWKRIYAAHRELRKSLTSTLDRSPTETPR